MRRHEQIGRHERLVDALADDLLGATDEDILASHAPGAARVVAGSLRQALRRAFGEAAEPDDSARDAPRGGPLRRDRDDEERR